MNNSEKKNNGDSKKIYSLLVLIAIVMVTTTGGTYAYLALSATATNKPTGTVAGGNLSFTTQPSPVAPTSSSWYANKPMVPQYAYNNSKNVLQLAVTGGKPGGPSSTAVPCVDDNGNVICKVYTFTIKNSSTATVKINGTFKFSGNSKMPNLKWKAMNSATSVSVSSTNDSGIKSVPTTPTTTGATTIDMVFENALSLSAGATKSYNFVFWIQEAGGNTAQTDSGTWTAIVSFDSSDGSGLTSTIKG